MPDHIVQSRRMHMKRVNQIWLAYIIGIMLATAYLSSFYW